VKLEPISQVIITDDFNNAIEQLKEIAPSDSRFELFTKENENFLVADANEVIAKAYLASKEKVFLILGSITFSDVVQNRLLKIIEEPPKNKEFILLTHSKSALLSTIKSRLPITNLKATNDEIELNLDITNLDLQKVYNFIQENKRIKPKEAIPLLEQIIKEAIKSKKYNLDDSLLTIFSDTREALEVGSPADFVLTALFLKLLAKKVKR